MVGKTLENLYIVLVEPSSVQAKVIANALTDVGLQRLDVVHDGTAA